MNTQDALPEIWQVEVNGQIYEASFEELAQWVAEGALLQQDKVRRGNLRWLEAGKIPSLYGFFNAKELGMAPPPILTTTNVAPPSETAPTAAQTTNFVPPPEPVKQNTVTQSVSEPQTQASALPQIPATESFTKPQQTFNTNFQPSAKTRSSNPNACSNHPTEEPKYICESCQNLFCKTCPKSYGGTVKVCPMCGEMCKPILEAQAKHQRNAKYHYDLTEGFGFVDFGRAFAYPFKFSFSLIAGAILFMFFSLGQGAAGIGGMIMISAAIFCTMLSNAMTFGCLANTVDNMAQGNLDKNFMPSFDDFSIWEDVVQPFFLSIATYISSFGLFAVLVIGMVWYTYSQVSSMQAATMNQMTQQIKDARERSGMTPNGEMIPTNGALTPEQQQALQERQAQELQNLVQEQRNAQLESVSGKTPEAQQQEMQSMVSSLLKIGIPLLVLGFLALLWGLIYFPAACAVAGYTRSFAATVNPLVGLDTIKRMGVDYVKILVMCVILALMSGGITLILNLVLAPFDLPKIGNLPAKAIVSLFTFYFSVVFSVMLGYALYKNSAKLNLSR